MADLIDPFDSPDHVSGAAPASAQPVADPAQGEIIDPYDDPGFMKYQGTPQQVTGPSNPMLPPLSPQQAADYGLGIRTNQMTDVRENPDPAGFFESLKNAPIEDPRVRIQKFAEERFPNEPPEQREERYRDVDGTIMYRDPHGNIVPEVSGVASTTGDIAGKFTLPAVGAIVGLIAGGPIGSALGGMGGLAWRKNIGLAMGDRQDAVSNAAELATQGAIDFAVPAIGGRIVKYVANRNAARDIASYDRAAAQRLQQLAQDRGIDLTAAEVTNLGSLINDQNRFSAAMDPAGDVLKQFYGDRATQIATVLDDFLRATPDLDVAGASARNVAAQSIDDAAAAVGSGSRSAYRTSVRPDNLVPERQFMELDADPLINKYINMVKESPESGLMDVPRNSTSVIDAAGKLMRDESEALLTQGKKFASSKVADGRRKLLGFMERTYPAYKDARTTQAMMRETHLDPLEKGIEGIISRTKDTSLAGIPKKLLSSENVSPRSVANWRREFVSQGMEGDWDNLVGAWLRKTWEGPAQKGRTVKDLSGARFREMVFGTPAQQKIMREAMGPARYRDFSEFMEVLEATGRSNMRQSMTQPATEAAKRDTSRAMGPTEGMVVGGLRTDITAPMRRVADWWADTRTGSWKTDMARIMTSPDALREMENLRQLRQMSPGSLRKTEVVFQVLAKAGLLPGAGSDVPEEVPLEAQP